MDNSAVNQPTHERISQIEMEKRLKEAGKQEQFYSIALFDILGFSNYVTTHGNQTILELYNKLLDIVYTPDISKAVPIQMSDDWKEGQYIANANGHVNVCHFSDTFIIIVLTDLYGLFLPVNYCGDSFAWLRFFWFRIDGFQQINIFWHSLSRGCKR